MALPLGSLPEGTDGFGIGEVPQRQRSINAVVDIRIMQGFEQDRLTGHVATLEQGAGSRDSHTFVRIA